jgi:aminopeptidase N
MLRRRMGDERFLAMLAQLRKRYQYRTVTTEQFRRLAAEFLPPKSPDPQLESFFDQYVQSTGIPTLKMSYSVKGKAPDVRVSGTITQTDVDEDFTTMAPVEIQIAKGRSIMQWVRTSSEPSTFTVSLRQPPSKVTLDPSYSVLRR